MAVVVFELSVVLGCEGQDTGELVLTRAATNQPPPPLSAAFLDRARNALLAQVNEESRILEIRANGRSFSVQVAEESKEAAESRVVQIDYVESPSLEGQPPIGQLYGPSPIELKGQGKVEENLFSLSDVDLTKVARSFSIAQLAVDPDDGKVEKLVVRRFLPFSSRVRARIYVHSPRMSGSIDTNHLGVPLRR